jgi:DNA invertase Pin-like site-specific DNA recombinase
VNGKTTALYCRVARSDDGAMAVQERYLLRFAERNGFGDCVLYRDNGQNGLTLDRPGLNALMGDIRDGRVDAVMTADLSRIARNAALFGDWLEFIESQGVGFISVRDGLRLDAREKAPAVTSVLAG